MHHYYYDLNAFVKNCAVPIDIITNKCKEDPRSY